MTSKDIDIFKGDLYCLGEMLLSSNQVKFIDPTLKMEWDYAYYRPYVYDLGNNKFMVVQFEGTIAELVELGEGLLRSIAIVKDEVFIRELVAVLKDREVQPYEIS